MFSTGILLSFAAMFAWGFGDFFIQKTSRALGSWKALFYIGAVSFFILLPFVWTRIHLLTWENILLLTVTGLIIIFAGLFDFEALRQGKIAIIEPVLGLELPITIALSVALLHEIITGREMVAIALVFAGILLAITSNPHHLKIHKRFFEKGVVLAGIGAIGMALNNFIVGFASQTISPLITIWFGHSMLGLVCLIVLLAKGEFSVVKDFTKHSGLILSIGFFDNAAWIAYAFATALIPISIVITISESYIIIAVLLGIYINSERIRSHQIVGITLAMIGLFILSLLGN